MSVPPASLTLSNGNGPGPPPLFSCTRRAEGQDSIRLVLVGELDRSARTHFQQALRDAQTDASRVTLDLWALTLIDCASLSVVFDGALKARRRDAVLILLEPRGQVRRVLDLIGAPDGVAVLERSDSEPLPAGAS
jgi:anti-anti-sigma factor